MISLLRAAGRSLTGRMSLEATDLSSRRPAGHEPKTMRRPSMLRILGAAAFAVPSPALALGNPASIYCESRGGKVEVTPGVNGGGRGICVLPDGTRIDEWVYFRNTHRTSH